ncbi:heavy metal translocating P-type ATPase [Herbiconiux sp. CPCC 203407]|uniref:Heavy metal translocating P-type ATPase n=1 Tax=Herbiconiux oxytropis TaxID=2970915 RepID=A0AA42BTX5_9MICO|nr:heavy metal translocating P-type ATPase [Herbiconiux oxytropis]MCS5724145.1 heavy metal translocating P-type ATPase [Herbiconiux oxytropis]MCS5726920.1 heavy metal translocating P-type ATPase [Herbiconiux oxytropis]
MGGPRAMMRPSALLISTGLVTVSTLLLVLWGQGDAARVVATVFVLAVAVLEASRMVRRLMQGAVGVDVLAVTAIVATVLVGEIAASMIIVLMLTGGEALEQFARARAQRELTSLSERAPRFAHRLSPSSSGAGSDVVVGEVSPGDLLLVRPAEIVPVDAVLAPGSDATSFDESPITGESLPRRIGPGEPVLSGTINGPSAVRIIATRDAAHSQYQGIVRLVEAAASHPAPVVRLADRFALPFTVLALLIGTAAWLLSGDPVRFAEVLVLATPCPLILAAPIAFLAGMSRSARNGAVVKGGAALERLSRVQTVAFDKTGTLTEGRVSIAEVRVQPGFEEPLVLRLAASAEQYSSHVLATAVIDLARARHLDLADSDVADEDAASGVRARVLGFDVLVGSLAFVSARASDVLATPLRPGELAIYVGLDGRFAGAIVARDRLRVTAAPTVTALRRLGARRIVMLTGDAPSTAAAIAEEVGIDDVRAECLPADKVTAVHGMEDRPVLMVGDGVNDAPVLAAADVGIALGARGATVASEAADVVILVDDLHKVVDVVRIGQDSVRIALQSIWIGVGLSLILMVVAAFGHIPAVLGAGIQELVDLVCIFNALRALRDPAGHRGDRL